MFVGGTESSDRGSFNGEPPFLSGQMVCREIRDNKTDAENEGVNDDVSGESEESGSSGSGKNISCTNCILIRFS